MSGVWVFKKKGSVIHLIENPTRALLEDPTSSAGGGLPRRPGRRTELVHVATGSVVRSHDELERHLRELGWSRYLPSRPRGGRDVVQFHRATSVDLISLPGRFEDLRSTHMYDIAVKNRSHFLVRDQPDAWGP